MGVGRGVQVAARVERRLERVERVGGVVAEVGRGGGRREGRGRGAERRLELERGGEAAQSVSSVGMLKKPSTRAVAGRAQRGRCDNCIFFFFSPFFY